MPIIQDPDPISHHATTDQDATPDHVASDQTAPPVLALHGWGQDQSSLKPLCDAIATKLKTMEQAHDRGRSISGTRPQFFSIDLPGFGQAPPPWEIDPDAPHAGDPLLGSWDTIQYARWVRGDCLHRGWRRVTLIGHSFGGRISLRLAAMFPEFVDSMILIGSAGLPARKSFPKKLRSQAIRTLGKACRLSARSRTWHQQRFGSRDYLAAGDMRRTLIRTVTEDQTSELPKIKCPTFLLWGEHDDAAPLDIGERLHAGIDGSRLQVIPDQGHFPFLGSGVYGCAEAIGEFMSEVQS